MHLCEVNGTMLMLAAQVRIDKLVGGKLPTSKFQNQLGLKELLRPDKVLYCQLSVCCLEHGHVL